ncbi:MAG: ExbD/TolR family protein [Bdellovibrionales bacterium]
MSQTGFLRNKVLYSPIASQSTLRPQSKKGRKGIGGALMLTSLVDAFSILVIFLMMNSAADNSDFQVDKAVVLPKASEAQTTFKTAVVKFSRGQIFINDKVTSIQNLGGALTTLHKQLKDSGNTSPESLVIVADQDIDFATLNPIIVAGSRVGFSEFKFAVQRDGQNQRR